MQFLVIGLDGDDEEAPARRQAARPDHIARGDVLVADGTLWYGAAILNDEGQMRGSMYLLDFPSEEEMQAWLDSEPYVLGEVWKNVEVYKCNVREPWQFSRPQEFFESRGQ